jgi:hypothetical protein
MASVSGMKQVVKVRNITCFCSEFCETSSLGMFIAMLRGAKNRISRKSNLFREMVSIICIKMLELFFRKSPFYLGTVVSSPPQMKCSDLPTTERVDGSILKYQI